MSAVTEKVDALEKAIAESSHYIPASVRMALEDLREVIPHDDDPQPEAPSEPQADTQTASLLDPIVDTAPVEQQASQRPTLRR